MGETGGKPPPPPQTGDVRAGYVCNKNSGYELEEAGGGDGSGDSSPGTWGVVGNWLASG